MKEARGILVVKKRRQTIDEYLLRIIKLLPEFPRLVIGRRGRLLSVYTRLHRAVSAPRAIDVDLLLREANEILAALIVADEDAKFPGCRNADGELALEGGLENGSLTKNRCWDTWIKLVAKQRKGYLNGPTN